jgi:hypothetical protein
VSLLTDQARRLHRPAARVAGAIVATAGLAFSAAGCGGPSHVAQLGSSTTRGSSASPAEPAQVGDAVAFSRCMRSHGVLGFPDPARGGAIPKVALQRLGVSSSRFQAAQSNCRRLLPNGGGGPTAAQLQQGREQALRFSQCVRDHGLHDFPDPGRDGRIPDPATVGIDQGSPRFEAANQACGRYRPPYMPSNAAYNSWARAHG